MSVWYKATVICHPMWTGSIIIANSLTWQLYKVLSEIAFMKKVLIENGYLLDIVVASIWEKMRQFGKCNLIVRCPKVSSIFVFHWLVMWGHGLLGRSLWVWKKCYQSANWCVMFVTWPMLRSIQLIYQFKCQHYTILGKMGQRSEAHIKQQSLTLPDTIRNKQGGEFA